ncbi:uncharacterized protein LOC129224385 [Uloborus diversus]|uniref:uncharacterized protein LOC129224385 n=1 Tax=Uloborus diversus TaxID=327109 RepID=UPI002408F6F5|nr:uncharacterized protein LOC129224385 [Uloborus diversus]
MIGYILLVLTILGSVIKADEAPIPVSDNKDECVKQMIDWCKGMQYPQEGGGMTMVSISYRDQNRHYRVFCASDSEGTNCTRNKIPWFYCSPDHTFSYKGQPVTDGSNVDNDICKTADKAFNDMFIQNMSFDNTTLQTELETGMESFFREITSMQQQIKSIQDTLRNLPVFTRSFWTFFDTDFPFGGPNYTETEVEVSKKDTNQIERE